MKIEALISSPAGGEFTWSQVELDEPREDEILVRIEAVGLCHTDLVAASGAFQFGVPVVLGHEGAGVVEKIGAGVTKVAPGDRVAITFRSCGACPKCDRGAPSYCHHMPALNYAGMRADGSRALHQNGTDLASNFFGQSSFATHALTYERNVVKLREGLPFEIAAPLGCGVQTGAGAVMRSFAAEAGSTIVIAGGGAVGLSAVMGAVIQGCAAIIVIEPFAARRALAMELGATHVIDPAVTPELSAAIRAINAIGVDYALDTTGRPDILQALVAVLAPQGTLGLVGIMPPGTPIPGDAATVLALGHSVKGIIEGDSEPDTFLPQLMDLYAAGKLPVDRLVTLYPIKDVNRAVRDQAAGLCIKAVLTVG